MNPIRLAFMGFRHGHIYALYEHAKQHPGVEIVAACEEDPETLAGLRQADFPVTHDNYARMLEEVPCDAIAVGDYYGKRGAVTIEALRRGKHVISDKPLCTRMTEYEEIARLAREQHLRIGCQLDLRELPAAAALREAVRAGRIGEVHAVTFTGQHPLKYGTRPSWYFEPDKHGGTLNDIAIHAMDYIPWATGRTFATVSAARGWNARLKAVPFFQDGAQVMLTLDNGGGVLGDVSYLLPDSFNYGIPPYWRITIWGADGMVEGGPNTPAQLFRNGADAPEPLPLVQPAGGAYLEAFVREIRGETEGVTLTTADVLTATRVSLLAQQAADRGETNVAL